MKSDSNPVFQYRAEFRAVAIRAQKWMMLGGVALVIVSAAVLMAATLCETGHRILLMLLACGFASLSAGIVWGFRWRTQIRDEFRAKYGPQ